MTIKSIALSNVVSFSFAKVFPKYLFALIISISFACWHLQILDVKSLFLPFNYFGDAIFYAMTIKSTITTGWYLTNSSIGVPDGHNLADFPTPELFNYLLIKGISFFTSNWVLVLNVFFLLGFPLVSFTSLFVFQRLGLSYPLALAASLLYTFSPYHLMAEESHLFLSGHYIPPLIIWLAMLVYQDALFVGEKKGRLFLYSMICVLLGSNGVYYIYFGSFFLLLAGIIASYRIRELRPLKQAVLLIAVISASLVVNLWPTVENQWKNGRNRHFMKRNPIETEANGLKITQLLLPRDGDRLFAERKEKYNANTVAHGENTRSSLGLIGGIGFLLLIGSCFFKRKTASEDLSLDSLAHFNLAALLLSIIGGFSSFISYFVLSGIRNYNRISVFIFFFCLAAVFLSLSKRVKNKKLLWVLSVAILTSGLYTQTSPVDAPSIRFPEIADEFEWDRSFVAQIEEILPAGSMVFQLPYMSFPEGPRDRINSYAHFKCALHSDRLKWSFGAMNRRPTSRWQKKASELPVPDMLKEIVQKGFTGLYLDKFAYLDDGRALMESLAKELKTPPIFDHHGRSFWDLRELQFSNPSGAVAEFSEVVVQRAH